MKILRIITRLNIGGPAIHVSLLNQAMNNSDGEFEELLLYGSLSESEGDMSYLLKENELFTCQLLDLKREFNLIDDIWAFLNIFRIIRDYEPDIVHTHTAKAGALGRLAVAIYNRFYRKRVKTIHTFHGNVFYGYFSKSKSLLFLCIERVLARFVDIIIAISKKQQREIYFKYKLNPRMGVKLIPLGFDLKRLFLKEESKGPKKIINIGRLVPVKNHKLLLMGFSYYQAIFRYTDPSNEDAKLLIVGDGKLKEELKKISYQLGFNEGEVEFAGWIKNIKDFYSSNNPDLFILTSINEGTPVALIEAMAFGVLTISTDVGGVSDLYGNIIEENERFSICERGILVKNMSKIGVAQAIDWALNKPVENNMSIIINNAREYVFENYSKERLISDIRMLYRKIME